MSSSNINLPKSLLLGLLVALAGPLPGRAQQSDLSHLRKFAEKGRWAKYPSNPVLKPGTNGEWDSWTLATANVLKVGDTCHMYYEAGSKGVIDFQIGHAISTDGIHWTKDPSNPVVPFGKKGDWDDMETWDPFVIYEDGVFKMWYGGTSLINGKRDFQIGYATSRDGTHFHRREKISNYPKGNMGDMHVVHDEQSAMYYMYFIDRNFANYAMFRAKSTNETGFDFGKAEPVVVEGEDAGYRCPQVFIVDHKWYMYYSFKSQNRAGYATSADGLHWKIRNAAVFEGHDPEVLKMAADLYLLFYCPSQYNMGHNPGSDIRVAIFAGHLDDLQVVEK